MKVYRVLLILVFVFALVVVSAAAYATNDMRASPSSDFGFVQGNQQAEMTTAAIADGTSVNEATAFACVQNDVHFSKTTTVTQEQGTMLTSKTTENTATIDLAYELDFVSEQYAEMTEVWDMFAEINSIDDMTNTPVFEDGFSRLVSEHKATFDNNITGNDMITTELADMLSSGSVTEATAIGEVTDTAHLVLADSEGFLTCQVRTVRFAEMTNDIDAAAVRGSPEGTLDRFAANEAITGMILTLQTTLPITMFAA